METNLLPVKNHEYLSVNAPLMFCRYFNLCRNKNEKEDQKYKMSIWKASYFK